MNLRKRAQGKPCYLRLPGVCEGGTETVVLCHIRRGGVAGMGQKPPDLCGLPACFSCHNELDKRSNMGGFTANEIDGYTLEGHQRWLAECQKQGWVTI